MTPDFHDKSILVTGGGSGMGEEFCRRFAAWGGKVAVLDLDRDTGERVAAAIRDAGGTARFVEADVTDAAGMERAVAASVAAHGGLDIAINNAGVAGRHALPDYPLDAWNRTIAINLTGVFHSLRAEIPAMQAKGGSIINMASITGVIAHPNSAAYVASKHGVIGLTKSAALEWGHAGIRINAVAPTWVRTPMTESVFDEAWWRELGAKHALGRCATMAEVAAVVAFLASDDAAIVTGSVYLADAGYTAG